MRRLYSLGLICGIMLLGLQALAAQALAAEVPTFHKLELNASHHAFPIDVSMWFPPAPGGKASPIGESHIFDTHSGIAKGKLAKGKFPVVLISHSMGSNRDSLAWLSSGLAQKGAIAISVDHPNSTYADMNLEDALEHWSRVDDLTATLDHLITHPVYSKVIDRNRIYAAGTALGGWTALSIGGIRGNLQGYQSHCQSAKATSDCEFIKGAGLSLESLRQGRWNRLYKDDRIKGVIAIEPVFTFGLEKSDLEFLPRNVLLIGLGKGKNRTPFSDFGKNGSNFEALFNSVSVLNLHPASHFTSMGICVEGAKELLSRNNEAPVCADPAGTDRAAIHQSIIEAVSKTLKL